MGHRDEDLTPPETRRLVNETLELLTRQAGTVRRRRRSLAEQEDVQRRLELIRRQAQTHGRGA